MWEILEFLDCFFTASDRTRNEDPTAGRLLAMLAIPVVLIASLYMGFAFRNWLFALGGLGAIIVLVAYLALLARVDPET